MSLLCILKNQRNRYIHIVEGTRNWVKCMRKSVNERLKEEDMVIALLAIYSTQNNTSKLISIQQQL